VSERWCAVCVLVVRVISLGMWVPKFHAFVVGCYVSGGVCLVLGFVVCSFVRDVCDGCGAVGV
jgi:flagellar biosynthesis protein FliR